MKTLNLKILSVILAILTNQFMQGVIVIALALVLVTVAALVLANVLVLVIVIAVVPVVVQQHKKGDNKCLLF
jgi:hypothetical protein